MIELEGGVGARPRYMHRQLSPIIEEWNDVRPVVLPFLILAHGRDCRGLGNPWFGLA